MDPRSFDALTRSLAAPKTRRGLLGGMVALVVGTLGASAQTACPIPGQTRNRKGDCNCPAGTDPCPGGCVDKKRDLGNCGGCGNPCPPDATCVKGECRCPAGGCATTTTTTTTAGPLLGLGVVCASAAQCDQSGGTTDCADNLCPGDGGPLNCCRTPGVACSGNCDCCGFALCSGPDGSRVCVPTT